MHQEILTTRIKNFLRSGAFGQKRSKAQHLVELVLFFPFLIGIIGVLTEIAYGFNTGLELNSALNRAVGQSAAIQRSASDASRNKIKAEIKSNTYQTLVKRKVPYPDTLEIETLETDDFLVILGTYKYTYAFKLVNLFFSAIPNQFYLKSIVLSNKALFAPNNFAYSDAQITKAFENYGIMGEDALKNYINQLMSIYSLKWRNDHNTIWKNYVEKIKKEQELKAQQDEGMSDRGENGGSI